MTEFSNTRSSAKSRPSSITTRKGAGFNGQTIAPPLLTRVFQGQRACFRVRSCYLYQSVSQKSYIATFKT